MSPGVHPDGVKRQRREAEPDADRSGCKNRPAALKFAVLLHVILQNLQIALGETRFLRSIGISFHAGVEENLLCN